LPSVLNGAYAIADRAAIGESSWEAAFVDVLEWVSTHVDQRRTVLGDDPELRRLRELVSTADALDPLQEMFDCLAKNTRHIYNDTPRRQITFRREWLMNHPYGEVRPGTYADVYHINARTYVHEDVAQLELQVHLDGFDAPSLLAVPALLTHELVCHAHAQVDRNIVRSQWAEGVMHWVAMFFLDASVAKIGLPYSLAMLHGKQFSDSRATSWSYAGRLAAESLVGWLSETRKVGHVQIARALTSKFALQVNVPDVPLAAKDLLASRLINIRNDKGLQRDIITWYQDRESIIGSLA
jgi:hypothetical protein